MKPGRKPLGLKAMTNAERQKRYRTRLKRKARQTGTVRPPRFRAYADFVPVFNAARWAAIAAYGPRWDLHPEAYVWARLPAPWVGVRVAGTDRGSRWSPGIRDHKLPVARFWPKGRLPIGPDYTAPTTIFAHRAEAAD
jgi:hypothetical protein